MTEDTPPIVQDAMHRIRDNFSKPAEPVMSQEEFEALPQHRRCFLICNVIGCGKVVSTHGLVCVQHGLDLAAGNYDTIPQVPMKPMAP